MELGQELNDSSLEQLLDILDECGHKSLIIEKSLGPLVSAISPFSVLQSHGVDRIHWLEETSVSLEGNIIYLCRNMPNSLRLVTLHARKSMATSTTLRLVVVPTAGLLTEWMLKEAEILGDMAVSSWNATFAKLGLNLSLFLSSTTHQDHENHLMGGAASALADLQYRYGNFGRISGFGAKAKRVHELLMDRAGEKQSNDTLLGGFNYQFGNTFVGSHIDHLILIDRDIDCVTPLLSQLTYQGLIDDTFGITSPGVTEVAGHKLKLTDPLFDSLCDLNFGEVGGVLNTTARQLQSEVDATHNAKSVAEIRDYVSRKLEHHQHLKINLKTHTEITEQLMSTVKSRTFTGSLTLQQDILTNQLSTWDAVTALQRLIYQGISVKVALQLACLICIVRGGIKEKYLHMLYDDMLKTYGYHYLQVIQRLEEKKMLSSKSSDFINFRSLARTYKLNSEEPLSEPYAGYVPLSTRLVQNTLSGGETRQAGIFFDNVQKSDNVREAKLRRILLRNTPGKEHPVVMVMFIGGVTYSEAASVRALESALGHKYNLMVATTDILSTGSIVATV